MSEVTRADVLIAGQGAAAFSAALYAARYQIDTVLAAGQFGGETAIGGMIENYPGAPDIDGFDLMLKFKEQVDKLEVPTLNSNVVKVARSGERFDVELEDGTVIDTLSVILAVGRERRKLGLPHEEEWTGKGVSYCSTCDAPLYRGKATAAVVGGGNAAVEGAILLARYAKDVYLIYRGEKLWRPEPILLRVLEKTGNVHVLLETEVGELIGDDMKGLTHIRLTRPIDGEDVLEVAGLMIEAGADPRLDVPRQLGLEINRTTDEVHVDRTQRTNVAGIFAAGDLTDGTDLKQTVTAAAQGAIAALSAYSYVMEHPSKLGSSEKSAVAAGSAD